MNIRTKKCSTCYGKILVPAGKCFKCKKLTESYCDLCQQYICKKHLFYKEHGSNECYCENCITKIK